MSRRALLGEVLPQDPAIRAYAFELFDHLTLGLKATVQDEPQRYPPPAVPSDWSARGLDLVNRTVITVAFGL